MKKKRIFIIVLIILILLLGYFYVEYEIGISYGTWGINRTINWK